MLDINKDSYINFSEYPKPFFVIKQVFYVKRSFFTMLTALLKWVH